jgi:hypothetical protein
MILSRLQAEAEAEAEVEVEAEVEPEPEPEAEAGVTCTKRRRALRRESNGPDPVRLLDRRQYKLGLGFELLAEGPKVEGPVTFRVHVVLALGGELLEPGRD